jgi:hypothetical protein
MAPLFCELCEFEVKNCVRTTHSVKWCLWPRHLQTLHSKHGRAISVQKLLTVFNGIYGRAICRFAFQTWPSHFCAKVTHGNNRIHGRAICRLKHFKCGRAIQGKNHSLYLSLCMAVPFANFCDLKSQNYGRAILLTTLHTTAASG